jgi:type III pantothenate kinase
MSLLIDMGNTRLKWAIANNLDIAAEQPISNTNISRNTLLQLWQTINPQDKLAISCVSANSLYEVVLSVADELWPGITIIPAKSGASAFGICNAYQDPEKLGVDRWLAMIAAYHSHRKALCIVDCGTAITVDVVDSSGKHLGGLINPGLRLMKEALAIGTENLNLGASNCPFGLATNTDAAIHNGTLSAACGLIEIVLKNQPNSLPLLLTGGDAEVVAAHLSVPAVIDPDLVLRGLALTLAKQA